jgi:5'-nucleotidase
MVDRAGRGAFVTSVALALTAFSACGGNGDATPTRTTVRPASTTTTQTSTPLEVLVTNDDGIEGPGLDALVEALRKEPGVHVDVVAPATNRSGTGGTTSNEIPAYTRTTTPSGYTGVSVDGFPADTLAVALDVLGLHPDLVLSGINTGQNLGPLTTVSGTVGAALAAGHRGVPALAISQGLGDPPDYASGVTQALAWLRGHRGSLPAVGGAGAPVANLNVPTCTRGAVRGLLEVRVATAADGGNPVGPSDCTSTAPRPDDDVEAFAQGWATLSDLPLA